MNILRDNTTLLLLLLAGSLIAITIYKGQWVYYLKPSTTTSVLSPNQTVDSEFEVYNDQSIGVYLTLSARDTCYQVDSLEVNLQPYGKPATAVEWMSYSVMQNGNSPEPPRLNGMAVCPGGRIFLSKVSRPYDFSADTLRAAYILQADSTGVVKATVDLIPAKKFRLERTNRFDFVILLYPILWIMLGVIAIAKVTRLIKK